MDISQSEETIRKPLRQLRAPSLPLRNTTTDIDMDQKLSISPLNHDIESESTTKAVGRIIETRAPKRNLLNIPQEVRDEIYSYLLVNPILGEASSVSASTSFGGTQKYNLHPNILYVCKQTYLEGIVALYGNHIFVDCSNNPGIWDFQRDHLDSELGVYGFGTWILEPHIINLCPLTRYTNAQPRQHEDKPSFCHTPGLQHVGTWNVLLSAADGSAYTSNPFAEFCLSLYRCLGVSLNISILPTCFLKQQQRTFTEQAVLRTDPGLGRNMIPLRMLRKVKSLVFKTATILEIPDYCYKNQEPKGADLSIPNLPSPELVKRYSELTNGVSPVVECVNCLYDVLEHYANAFDNAMLLVSNNVHVGSQRNIRVHDMWAHVSQEVDSVRVFQRSNPELEGYTVPLTDISIANPSIDHSLDHFESNEDIILFKQNRGQLLATMESQYQEIRACCIRFREHLQRENRPTGILSIGPSRATDQEEYWNSMARMMEQLEKYEYAFVRGLTEELQHTVQKENRFIVLKYYDFERELLMKKVRGAYERRMWKKFTKYFKSAVELLDKHFLNLRLGRMDLFKWDIFDRGTDLDNQFERYDRIIWTEQKSSGHRERKYIVDVHGGDSTDKEMSYDSGGASDDDSVKFSEDSENEGQESEDEDSD